MDASFGTNGVLIPPYGITSISQVGNALYVAGANDTPDAVITKYLLDGNQPPANQAPTITGTPAVSVVDGAAYAFTPSAQDADGDALTFSVSGKPSWATFNTTTGALTGTPSASDRGVYAGIVISVSDGKVMTSLPAFSITVERSGNSAPVIAGLQSSYTVELGASFTRSFTITDPDGDTLGTPELTGAPGWLHLSGTSLNGTADKLGSTKGIQVRVSDSGNAVGSVSFDLTVQDTTAPVVTLSHAPEHPGSLLTAVLAASDAGQVKSVAWVNQTTKESGNCSELKGQSGAWTADIPLVGGANTVVFTATDGSDNAGTLSQRFTYTPAATWYADAALVAQGKTFDELGLTGKLQGWDPVQMKFVPVAGRAKPVVGNYLVVAGVDPASLPVTTPWALTEAVAEAPAVGKTESLTPVNTGTAAEVPWSNSAVQVEVDGQTKTLAAAQAAGEVEDYAWAYNETTGTWTLVVDASLLKGLSDRATGGVMVADSIKKNGDKPTLFFVVARKAGVTFKFTATSPAAVN